MDYLNISPEAAGYLGLSNSTPTKNVEKKKNTKSKKVSKEELVKAMEAKGITSPKAQANILAQLEAESQFILKSESLNYSPEKLFKTFPNHIESLKEAKELIAQGEKAVANKIYGGRMGNAENEGYKYRGRGLIQLTGKNNYEYYGKLIGEDLVANPEKANDPKIATKIALEYMQQNTEDLENFEKTSKAIRHVTTSEEEERRQKIKNKHYKEKGIFGEPVNFNISPAIPVKTLSLSKTLKKKSDDMLNKSASKTNEELFLSYDDTTVKNKKNPKIVDDLTLKVPQNIKL